MRPLYIIKKPVPVKISSGSSSIAGSVLKQKRLFVCVLAIGLENYGHAIAGSCDYNGNDDQFG